MRRELPRKEREGACERPPNGLCDRAPVGYLLLDATGVIQDSNRTGAAVLDWPRERLRGAPFGRWVARDDRDLFARHLDALQAAKGRLTEELRLKTRSGWPVIRRTALFAPRIASMLFERSG